MDIQDVPSQSKKRRLSHIDKDVISSNSKVTKDNASGSSIEIPITFPQKLDELESGNPRGLSVQKRADAVPNEGVLYESLMFLWVLLRLLEDDRVDRFHIAQNIDEVGAFDDLVFHVKYHPVGEDKPVTKLVLVQLKHIRNKPVTMDLLTTASGKGYFHLLKYYKSFKSVIDNIGKFKEVVLNECQIEEMTFIICTNAESQLWNDNYPKNSLCREFLDTGGKASIVSNLSSAEYLAKFQLELKKKNSPLIQENAGQYFLQNLIFFFKQSNCSNLQEMLQRKLTNFFITKNIFPKNILQTAIDFIKVNNDMWMSLHSGVLFDVTINFQGFSVKLNDMRRHWKNPELYKKIIIKHVCQEKDSLVSVGKLISPAEDYYIERKVGRDIMNTNVFDEKFIILSAAPGMGKSFFFTKQAYEVKQSNSLQYVIRESLLDHTSYLQDLNISDNRNVAEQFLVEMADVTPGAVDYEVFKCCLEGDYNMVIFLDGIDEIHPHYFHKVCHIIQAICAEFRVQLWVSTRSILEEQMKQYFDQEFWTLREFTLEDTKSFLRKYCKDSNYELNHTEEKLCTIPLFCKMLGDVITSSKLNHLRNAIRSKVDLYDTYIEVKYQVFYKEKEKVDISIPAIRKRMENDKQKIMEKFEMVAILKMFGKDKISELKWSTSLTDKSKDFLEELCQGVEYMGLITKINADQSPIFIHQSIVEYFCGRWFSKNAEKYKEYVEHPGNSIYSFPEEVDYFMSSKLNGTNSLFSLVLKTEEEKEIENSLAQYTDNFNDLDPIGRDVLHYANLVNNYKASKYILFNGYNLTEDNVSGLDMYRQDITSTIAVKLLFRWLADKLKEYPHYAPLLGLLLFTYNLREYVLYFLMEHSKNSPLHVAILKQCKEDIKHEETNLNSRDELGLTPLHVAVCMKDVNTIKLLGTHGAQYSRDNVLGVYPHQYVLHYNEKVYHVLKQFYGNFMNEDAIRADIMAEDYVLQDLPLHNAVQKKELWKYLKSNSNLNSLKIEPDSKGRSVLHVVAASSCEEVFGGILEKIDTYIEYTRDDGGSYPHHYSKNILIHTWLENRGIESIYRCLAPEDLKIHGLGLSDLLLKIMPTPDEYVESVDAASELKTILFLSVSLQLTFENPTNTSTTTQNEDEFSVLYNAVFRSLYNPQEQDKRLLNQLVVLKNHMVRKFILARQKISSETHRIIIDMNQNYFFTFLTYNFEKFQDHLKEHTLEEIMSIVLIHGGLMSADENHLDDCFCWELLKLKHDRFKILVKYYSKIYFNCLTASRFSLTLE